MQFQSYYERLYLWFILLKHRCKSVNGRQRTLNLKIVVKIFYFPTVNLRRRKNKLMKLESEKWSRTPLCVSQLFAYLIICLIEVHVLPWCFKEQLLSSHYFLFYISFLSISFSLFDDAQISDTEHVPLRHLYLSSCIPSVCVCLSQKNCERSDQL